MTPTRADFLIVGGGIVGLALARELVQQGAENIVVLEKEVGVGLHASGRNSGVLHAGLYYPPGSLKARLCLQGNLEMQAFCQAHGLPLVHSGKVVVARDAAELPALHALHQRALENGARVELIDERQLADIEPNARTCGQALYSHDTAVVDPRAILATLAGQLTASGKVTIRLGTRFCGLRDDQTVRTPQGDYRFRQFINAAGAYADRVAHAFGLARAYALIPFKGIYRRLRAPSRYEIRGNLYPVPDPRNPFLGVHFTRNIHGDIYVGPTAIPAYGRENYGILGGIDGEAVRILYHQARMFFKNAAFRQVALTEPKKYLRRCFFRDARRLVKTLQPDWLEPTSKVGIRPQLIDVRAGTLLMDFKILKDAHTLHILNAVSPAFTSAFAFARWVVAEGCREIAS